MGGRKTNVIDGKKPCRICKELKSVSEFRLLKDGNYYPYCKECSKSYAREQYKKRPKELRLWPAVVAKLIWGRMHGMKNSQIAQLVGTDDYKVFRFFDSYDRQIRKLDENNKIQVSVTR